MNRLLLLFSFLLVLLNLEAQPYGNEWIDYDKTYYKFTVSEDKVYRIPYSTLTSQFNTTDLIGANFQLFGKGEEVAIYVSTDGQFGANDYIEFYGKKNDGSLDTPLYKSGDQPNPYFSLYNDRSAYFLTFNEGDNKHLEPTANNTAGLSAEPYFWHTARSFFIDQFNDGNILDPFGDFSVLRDSYYGTGEGWTGTAFNGPATRNRSLNTPSVYTSNNSLAAILEHTHVTKSYASAHDIQISVGSSTFNYNYFGYKIGKIKESIPLDDVSSGTTTVGFRENINNSLVTDAVVSIKYPRTFNFGGASTFAFEVENTNATLLEINNFNWQGDAPVLYDVNNNQQYTATIDGNVLKFGLTNVSNTRSLILTGQGGDNLGTISSLEEVNFKDYSLLDNQGDYFIISHKDLTTSSDNVDYVAAYNEYRNSIEGGSYNSKIAFIQAIENQFGYGVRNHPMAIRNFINYAIDRFQIDLSHIFIIGKGISYTDIRFNSTNFNNCKVVSMGAPDSDVFMTARNAVDERPQVPIGRLSANNGDKIAQYYNKVVEFEAAQNDTIFMAQTVENKQWMKRALHLGGGRNGFEQLVFKSYLNSYKTILEDPFYGGDVSSVFKTSSEPIQVSTSEVVDSLIENGISLITFFGHSTTSTIDFDIQPEQFNNYGKYNLFLSNGCFVGSIFGPSLNTYSDRFIFQDGIGSIAYIAPITLGVSSSLNVYSRSFYTDLSKDMYGSTIGQIMQDVSTKMLSTSLVFDWMLSRQMILHGDPALRLNTHQAPDYVISQESINYNPSIVSASSDSFNVEIAVANIGKAIDADFDVNIRRIFPNGSFNDYKKRVAAPYFKDTVVIRLPTDRINGLGTNILTIKVDYGEEIAEISELNNEVKDTLVIFADDIIPIIPYEFCIATNEPDKIYFSTASINTSPKTYKLQIDTTAYFNSPLFDETEIVSSGGIIEWAPNIEYIENTVYYVRSTLDSLIGGEYNWNNSSYLYDTTISGGWNQSHFFQFLRDDFFTLELDEPDRQFKFSNEVREIRLKNALVKPGFFAGQDIEVYLDGNLLQRNTLSKASMNFFVFDPATGKYLESYTVPEQPNPNLYCELGTFDDINGCAISDPRAVMNYIIRSTFWRRKTMNFINMYIPDGAYVLAFTSQEFKSNLNFNLPLWEADTNRAGIDRSLFTVFEEELGATEIRNLQDWNPYVLWTQKGNPDFEKVEFSVSSNTIIDTTFFFSGAWNAGALRSTTIGPALKWDRLEIDQYALENSDYDVNSINITGIDVNGESNLLYANVTDSIFPLDGVNAEQYPYLSLELFTRDDSARTATQIEHWRVIYDKVPEAAVNPELSFFISADSIDIGQSVSLGTAITNISDIGMDSMLVKLSLNREGGNTTNITKRFPPLPVGQSINLDFELGADVIENAGKYAILLEANPDNDQPEQFHFNNYATFLLDVKDDNINPLLDVTFDGIHILDGDIVSPTPEILMKLKDENTGLALKDTSSFELFVYFPDQPNTPVRVNLDSDNITFVPADENQLDEKNEALLYFNPTFEQDGIYRLRVQGKDARNNEAGKYDYIISFEVINETSISNFLNYPNPFSTSTRFVFTLTGAEIPDEIKIQIMTVSGRVVREITADELGPLRIGRNLTEFAWDGTDRFGDPLANGVYIYKVFTRLNGESIKQYETSADKFFKNGGFGKLYIAR